MADTYSFYSILEQRAASFKKKHGALPALGRNASKEPTILEEGTAADGQHFYRLRTLQHNGWIGVNTYYQDGSTEETFER